jgi:hypothetical protein
MIRRPRQLTLALDPAAPEPEPAERPARASWPCAWCGQGNAAVWWTCQHCGNRRRRRPRPSLAAPPIADDPV